MKAMSESSIPRAAEVPQQSPCINAHAELDRWDPENGRTDQVILLIGRCECTSNDFDLAVILLESREVVVWGGLKQDELLPFRDKLSAKMRTRPIVVNDGSEIGIVVPCPPPKPELAEDLAAA
jgi:hypothetical protein